jgi:hypothetical protein
MVFLIGTIIFQLKLILKLKILQNQLESNLGLGLSVVHDEVGGLVDHLSNFPQVDHFYCQTILEYFTFQTNNSQFHSAWAIDSTKLLLQKETFCNLFLFTTFNLISDQDVDNFITTNSIIVKKQAKDLELFGIKNRKCFSKFDDRLDRIKMQDSYRCTQKCLRFFTYFLLSDCSCFHRRFSTKFPRPSRKRHVSGSVALLKSKFCRRTKKAAVLRAIQHRGGIRYWQQQDLALQRVSNCYQKAFTHFIWHCQSNLRKTTKLFRAMLYDSL